MEATKFATIYNKERTMNKEQKSNFGVVCETAQNEMRVAMTPNAVREVTLNGHNVWVQFGAGSRAGFTDEEFKTAGANMVPSTEEVYMRSDIMMKIHRPTVQEIEMVKPQQVVFCFMNKTGEKTYQDENTMVQKAMSQRQAVLFYYEFIQTDNNSAPVINAISEVSGYLAVQQGMKYMESQFGGCGRVLGQIAGETGSNVLIVGSGVAAYRSANVASAVGAKVTVMDISTESLRWINDNTPDSVQTMTYTAENLEKVLPTTQLLIGAVIPNQMSPNETTAQNTLASKTLLNSTTMKHVINNYQMNLMQKGSVAVDLGMTFGGNFEASSMTSTDKPVLMYNGKVLVNAMKDISNITPNTTSKAISNAVLPIVLNVANKGWKRATVEHPELHRALTIAEGRAASDKFAKAFLSLENTQEQFSGRQLFPNYRFPAFNNQTSLYNTENAESMYPQYKAETMGPHWYKSETMYPTKQSTNMNRVRSSSGSEYTIEA